MAATKNEKTAAPANAKTSKYQVHEGVELSGDGGQWNAVKSRDEDGNSVPLVGWCVRSEPRTSPKFGDHIAGVVEISQPTVVVDAAGKVSEQEDGVVSITLSVKKLEEFIPRFDDQEYVEKLQFLALGRKELANGHTLQDYSVKLLARMKRADYERMKLEALAKQIGAAPTPAQLSAGGNA